MTETTANVRLSEVMQDAQNALNRFEQVARDAEERAAELRKFVQMYRDALTNGVEDKEDGYGRQTPASIALFMTSPSFGEQIEEKVDEVAHVHSGSTHGSHVRQAKRAMRSLLAGEHVSR